MVRKNTLLLIAGVIWIGAGFNVLFIGITTLELIEPSFLLLSTLTFIIFFLGIFRRLVVKHTARINSYSNQKRPIYNFFDKKSYLIMILMISAGIIIRQLALIPRFWIATLYSGIGTALFVSGLLFITNYFKIKKSEVN